ncbi:exosortase Y-associated Wzy-like protein [Mucilaginibacter angelicae]|uniref:Exosortase Y-associated Wzy-like protein n=1 Tax=Mucilaginibacter angelicae TaxID=869718 RepID=A0ABV6L532_9SPHI
MYQKNVSYERLIVLYLPWLLALLFKNDTSLSYMIAWTGSFLIFFLTLSGWVKPLPGDRSVAEQLMRPIFLVHIIFAGYMACTSIFYFMNALGYQNFVRQNYVLVNRGTLEYIAQCQRYYCLSHAAFVSGILIFMNYPVKSAYYIEKQKLANLLMGFAVISFPVSVLFLKVPGLSQFYYQLNSLSFIAGTLALAFAIPLKKTGNTLICLCFYFFNFYQALISGFKEPIIISVLVLGIFLYPSYKKLVAAIFIPALLILFMFLPTYNRIFRQNAWGGDANTEEATQLALDAALNSTNGEEDDSNWGFLIYRLSEIDMFIKFVQSTPKNVDFYGLSLVKQSAIVLVPRICWPSKPITEDLVMERVYDAGVVNRASNVSAKPAFIVDAYLSGGAWGIFLSMFIYGAVAQLISAKAEQLFGGYILGTALIFSGLFQILWRGLSFEFLINSVFWSYMTMLAIHKILVATHVLKER